MVLDFYTPRGYCLTSVTPLTHIALACCCSSKIGIYRRKGFEDALLVVPPSRPHIKTIYDAFQHGMQACSQAID